MIQKSLSIELWSFMNFCEIHIYARSSRWITDCWSIPRYDPWQGSIYFLEFVEQYRNDQSQFSFIEFLIMYIYGKTCYTDWNLCSSYSTMSTDPRWIQRLIRTVRTQKHRVGFLLCIAVLFGESYRNCEGLHHSIMVIKCMAKCSRGRRWWRAAWHPQ